MACTRAAFACERSVRSFALLGSVGGFLKWKALEVLACCRFFDMLD